ncbi:hypothetical protein [Xenorhabdus szentirmaii]|uniref:Uncharacterized protein n=1 Tax=Xenorhabdus szentirmaii DSM 16338 TaxID=1427518 RepID=W1IR85_9GAMM|nr:hypothetical protein [Xenorhabdus szentirmaii]PHM30524.1 hypothetical protein Xsze_04114 [Xenorhabdus szentirmaii DSM 16338]CDL80982.1 conserved hypothetical protein [Xenorhabdus szentirmaii DSM 16338]
MNPAKIKLIESAFSGYNGVMFGVEFENGVSKSLIPFLDQQRICSIMKAETIDGKNMSGAASLSESRELTAKQALEAETKAQPVKPMERTAEKAGVRYSRAELEAVADKGGISALRKIGNDLDVREKSIEAMIESILKIAGE